jgi:hypothetical protein
MTPLKTQILVDDGDPQETLRIKELLGYVDGQTTKPSVVASNSHIKQLRATEPITLTSAVDTDPMR